MEKYATNMEHAYDKLAELSSEAKLVEPNPLPDELKHLASTSFRPLR